MDIVFVMPQFKSGGGNRVFIELANILVNSNNVYIIYPLNSSEKNSFLVNNKIKIRKIGKLAENNIRKLWNVFLTFIYLYKNHKSAKIVISDPILSSLWFFFKIKNGFRFIQGDDYNMFNDRMTIKNQWALKIYKYLVFRSYSLEPTYIFNSKYTYIQFNKIREKKLQQINLVYPAINMDIFKLKSPRKKEADKIAICLMARSHPMKGFQTFLSAWKILPHEVKLHVDKVIIITQDNLEHFDVNEFEVLVPRSDYEIAEQLKISDLFISTSWSEGFGLPPLEAMACGCACIISNSGGVNEYAVAEKNCLMFEPRDENGLKNQMFRLIKDKELRRQISEQGQRDSSKFTWQSSASQFLNIIE